MAGKNAIREKEIEALGFVHVRAVSEDGKSIGFRRLTCSICGARKDFRSDKLFVADFLKAAAHRAGWSWLKGKPVCHDQAKHKGAAIRWHGEVDHRTDMGRPVLVGPTWGALAIPDALTEANRRLMRCAPPVLAQTYAEITVDAETAARLELSPDATYTVEMTAPDGTVTTKTGVRLAKVPGHEFGPAPHSPAVPMLGRPISPTAAADALQTAAMKDGIWLGREPEPEAVELPGITTREQAEAFMRSDPAQPVGLYKTDEATIDVTFPHSGMFKRLPDGGRRPVSVVGKGGAWRDHLHSKHNPTFRAMAIAAIERGLSNVAAAIEIGCSDNAIRAVRLDAGLPQAIEIMKSKGQSMTTPASPQPVAAPPAVTVLPREMVPIIEKIDAFYDVAGKRWRAPWSDQKIGEALSLPAAKVAYVRRDLYGELAADPELAAIRADVDSLREMLGAVELRLRAAEKASSGGNIR